MSGFSPRPTSTLSRIVNDNTLNRRRLMTLRRIWFGTVIVLLPIWLDGPTCHGFHTRRQISHLPSHKLSISSKDDDCDVLNEIPDNFTSSRRRRVLLSLAVVTSLFPLASDAQSTAPHSLENIAFGRAHWTSLGPSGRSVSSSIRIPASFCTYLARFLINYDAGVGSWWQSQVQSVSLLSPDKQRRRLGQAFGKLAASLQQALETYLGRDSYSALFQRLLEAYPGKDTARQIGILCALLPKQDQPTGNLRNFLINSSSLSTSDRIAEPLLDDLSTILPSPYHMVEEGDNLVIFPPLSIYQVGLDEEFGQTATATPFGPLASELLTRDVPSYTVAIYTILGLCGATGCALTHSLVIPLDVVKTKAQTNPEEYSDIMQGVTKIVREEGLSGLLTGAEATLAGYFWYGLSVYPSYTFFKRYLGNTLFSSEWSVAHVNMIAVLAGALAAVVASFGLTPLEAARIRVVADPQKYKSMGLRGTLQVIASDRWTRLYAGLPSLLTRQVIFGSVKFLAFERACDIIYSTSPALRDSTWTALGVSLVAGGVSGILSSIVSQPADSVLTYVSRSNGDLSFFEASQVMVEEGGIESLFRGLESRCLWAGSIIAGQFLLYDIFRNLFGVTVNDLSQVLRVDI